MANSPTTAVGRTETHAGAGPAGSRVASLAIGLKRLERRVADLEVANDASGFSDFEIFFLIWLGTLLVIQLVRTFTAKGSTDA